MEEREQKTMAQATDHPKGERLEAEGLSGVQTFMEITEDVTAETLTTHEYVAISVSSNKVRAWFGGKLQL